MTTQNLTVLKNVIKNCKADLSFVQTARGLLGNSHSRKKMGFGFTLDPDFIFPLRCLGMGADGSQDSRRNSRNAPLARGENQNPEKF